MCSDKCTTKICCDNIRAGLTGTDLTCYNSHTWQLMGCWNCADWAPLPIFTDTIGPQHYGQAWAQTTCPCCTQLTICNLPYSHELVGHTIASTSSMVPFLPFFNPFISYTSPNPSYSEIPAHSISAVWISPEQQVCRPPYCRCYHANSHMPIFLPVL